MNDYIKREDAIKAFDPSQRRDWYTPWIVETLEGLPSADAVPVVRRKDCKHSRNDELWHMRWCKGLTVKDEHFCADGESK